MTEPGQKTPSRPQGRPCTNAPNGVCTSDLCKAEGTCYNLVVNSQEGEKLT